MWKCLNEIFVLNLGTKFRQMSAVEISTAVPADSGNDQHGFFGQMGFKLQKYGARVYEVVLCAQK